MELTVMQYLGLLAYPLSLVSLTWGSLTHQNLKAELNDKFGFVAKLKIAPFFLVVAFTKVWILTESMQNLKEIHVGLTLLPALAVASIQFALHLIMKVNWQDSVFSTIGNMSSLRKPEGDQKFCLRLYKVESFTSAVTYALMTLGSFALCQRNTDKTLTSTYICMGLLAIYMVVSQSYLLG